MCRQGRWRSVRCEPGSLPGMTQVVFLVGNGGQHGTGLGTERHDAPAGLGVAQTKKLKHNSGLLRIPHSTASILP